MTQERRCQARDGLALAWRFDPGRDAERTVLVVHGYAEHSGRYDRVVETWNARGLNILRFDLRGHGESEGPRGSLESFDQYITDVETVLDEARDRVGSDRVLLFGHSLGGLIAITATLRYPERFDAVALCSPYLGLALAVPAVKRLAAPVLSRLFPHLRLPSGFSGRDVTRDEAEATKYDEDPLGFSTATPRFFTETLAAQQAALSRAAEFRAPLLCMAAGSDRLASPTVTRDWFERVGSTQKKLVVVSEAYHELLNDLGRDKHVAAFGDWLCEQAKIRNPQTA